MEPNLEVWADKLLELQKVSDARWFRTFLVSELQDVLDAGRALERKEWYAQQDKDLGWVHEHPVLTPEEPSTIQRLFSRGRVKKWKEYKGE